jgi:dipeptidyl aminopeptidase/acylaminoacyl peptidase
MAFRNPVQDTSVDAGMETQEQANIQQGGLPPLISRDIFYGNPEIYDGKLSPDGEWLSFTKEYNGIMNVWIKGIVLPLSEAIVLTKNENPIPRYHWTHDSKYILFLKDNNGDGNFDVYAADVQAAKEQKPDVSVVRKLTSNRKGVRAIIYHICRKNADVIYIGLNERNASWHDLYTLHIGSGELTLIRENNDRIVNWIFDWNDELRIASRYLNNGTKEILKLTGDAMVKIFESNVMESGQAIKFSKDNSKVYIITNKGEHVNYSKLITIDLTSPAIEDVHSDPLNKCDIHEVIFSDVTHEIQYIVYKDTRARRYWINKALGDDYVFLEERFPDRVIDLESCTADESKYLVKVWSCNRAIHTYIFDRSNRSLIFQYIPRPDLKAIEQYLPPFESFTYKSSDGLEIQSYLTLPHGVAHTGLPLLVLPHPGPWERYSYNFYLVAQLMANRGFAVLQPNFRGSTGYGKTYLNAGNKEWGGKMQDDLTWGVKYLVEQKIVDPKRVAIMGTGYGGFATLAGLAFTPEIYACGIDIAGPYNLVKLIASIPAFWEAEKKILLERVGDNATAVGEALLQKASPWFNIDKIKAPLLIVQGVNDPKVRKDDTDKLVATLRDLDREVHYLVADDEGHGFTKPLNNLAMMTAIERFLAKHCGTRYEENVAVDVQKRLEEITVDVATLPRN